MLRKHGHEVAFSAFWGLQGPPSSGPEGMPVFGNSGEDPWGRDVLPVHYKLWQADLCITLLDAWVLKGADLAGMSLLHWLPVDSFPLSGLDRDFLASSPGRAVAMSRFGQRQLEEAGHEAFYAPHALDTGVWSPLEDRAEARQKLGWSDSFIIGINAANQDPERKGLFEQIAAFARFSARHPEARMVIHSRQRTGNGVKLDAIIADQGLRDKVILGDQVQIGAHLVSEPQMVSWHGVIDVLSNCSYAEGFGLATLQAQACGTPVVVTDGSASRELCGAGWKVAGQEHWNRGHDAKWIVPSIDGIDRAYEKAWRQARDPAMREKARRFAVRYDHEQVFRRYWQPVLEQAMVRKAAAGRPREPRLWAPVMFAGETDMLDMRLAEMQALGARHVLAEATQTHRGVPRQVVFPSLRGRYRPYLGSVTHMAVSLPPAPDPWVREHAQRDEAWRVVAAGAADEDWVLIGDLDEIPSPDLLAKLSALDVPVVAIRMRVLAHAVNWEADPAAVPPQCVAARAGWLRLRAAEGVTLSRVRDRREHYEVIEDGWHLTWMGGPQAAAVKLDTGTCHTEILGTPEEDLIRSGARWRDGADGGALPVRAVEVDESFPAWIRDRKCPQSWFRPLETAEVGA